MKCPKSAKMGRRNKNENAVPFEKSKMLQNEKDNIKLHFCSVHFPLLL